MIPLENYNNLKNIYLKIRIPVFKVKFLEWMNPQKTTSDKIV